MRRSTITLLAAICFASPASAQGLRDKITDLFKFGNGCNTPICLSVDGQHGDHYNPAAGGAGTNLIAILTSAIAASAANFPISAASSGSIWGKSAEGLPIRTRTSSGPIFAERAQTIGKGHLLIGANVSSFDFQSIRGLPLTDLEFNFVHQDVPPAGLGDPVFEDDYIAVQTRLSIHTTALTGFVTYGLGKQVDLSIAVPFVRTSLSGTSVAQVISFVNPTPHFFGTAANPLLRVSTSSSGAATGIGDVAARLKVGFPTTGRIGVAFLADARLPTGSEDDFLGSGSLAFRGLAIASGRYGNTSPHVNLGYAHRGSTQNDAVLATIGFDHLVAPWVTFAADAITEWSVGTEKFTVPGPVTFTLPVGGPTSIRIVDRTNLPDRRDHVLLGSFGAKFTTRSGMTVVTNLLLPVRFGGLQPNIAWTTGLEYSF
ncbi:MAG: hypothetical protein ABI647_18030 [Gemmatimonadota bacterium]